MADSTVRLVFHKRWFFQAAAFIAWALLQLKLVKPRADAAYPCGYETPEQRVGRWLLESALIVRVE